VIKHVSQLRGALQEEGSKISPPAELKQKVLVAISASRPGKLKRHIAAVLIALCIIPTSAFAYQSFQADGLYGSFNNLKKHVASATLEGYMIFNAKLSQAKGELGDKEYEKFKEELSVLTDAKLKYGDEYGNINYDALPVQEREKLRRNAYVLQPYFDRLNGDVSSKELLSAKEYSLFIDALMIHETVMAKAKVDTTHGTPEIEEVPVEFQEEYRSAEETIYSVYDLQETYKQKQ
jgi:hypothetical protein